MSSPNMREITFQDKLKLLKYRVDEICRPNLGNNNECSEASKNFIELMDKIYKNTRVAAETNSTLQFNFLTDYGTR